MGGSSGVCLPGSPAMSPLAPVIVGDVLMEDLVVLAVLAGYSNSLSLSESI